jgi:hypothetical protein
MERSRKNPAEDFEPPGTKPGVGLYPSDRQESSGLKSDDLVKSPSIPLGAGLRGNFVVAAHPQVRLTPQFLRALHGRGAKHRAPTIETIDILNFT